MVHKIAIVTTFNSLFHAEWTDQFSFGLAERLNALGFESVTTPYHNAPALSDTKVYDSRVAKALTLGTSRMNDLLRPGANFNRMEKFLGTFRPDAVFATAPWRGIADIARSLGTKLVFWMTYPVEPTQENADFVRRCDLVFAFARGIPKLYEEIGIGGIHWLPLGYDPSYYGPRPSGKTLFPMVFVGTYNVERSGHREILYPLIRRYGKAVHLFGRGWGKNPAVRGAAIHGILDWRRISDVFCRSSIVIGMHQQRTVELNGVNGRVYEALGSSAFLLSDFVPAMEELFEIDTDFAVLRRGDDPVDAAERFLHDPELRARVAGLGYKRVSERDTVGQRARAIADALRTL